MGGLNFTLDGVGEWEIFVPPTVYPPKEDTEMLCHAISELSAKTGGKALEIGCGSGLVTIVLTSLGWEVTACDVNPFAVACTRGNLETNDLSGKVCVIESGIGEEMPISENTDLIVWNLPYLDEEVDHPGLLEKMEEAALSDIAQGGWGRALLQTLENNSATLCDRVLVILVMRTDPEGSSRVLDWEQKGWSWRSLKAERYGAEKIEVIGFWRTGSGVGATVLDSCTSTMEEAARLPNDGWQRIFSKSQTNGRGRRNSDWISEEGGVFATWNLDTDLLENLAPGLIQTSIGAVVSDVLGANMKWPNDIVDGHGRKMGGVLLESSNNDKIRVGVGANRNSFVKGDVSASGWEETLGAIDASEVFLRIDRGISSIFESNGKIAIPTQGSLARMSWKALSRSLSKGVQASLNGELLRPTGLNDKGELEASGIEGFVVLRELDGIGWIIPKK
ncbi:MAG: methyltransferase [Candidatus Poseidoniia archaeon]|jgi:methylase of polypeptide subunit release factors/biotin-(acetyl-CoA carboxylase) ligase